MMGSHGNVWFPSWRGSKKVTAKSEVIEKDKVGVIMKIAQQITGWIQHWSVLPRD
jgi:hypothetical protein